MADQPIAAKPPSVPVKGTAEKLADSTAAPPSANQLTPEEQMALFEKDLKENDWGHQPC